VRDENISHSSHAAQSKRSVYVRYLRSVWCCGFLTSHIPLPTEMRVRGKWVHSPRGQRFGSVHCSSIEQLNVCPHLGLCSPPRLHVLKLVGLALRFFRNPVLLGFYLSVRSAEAKAADGVATSRTFYEFSRCKTFSYVVSRNEQDDERPCPLQCYC